MVLAVVVGRDAHAHARRAADVVIDPGREVGALLRGPGMQGSSAEKEPDGGGREKAHRGQLTPLKGNASLGIMRRLGLALGGLLLVAAGLAAQAPWADWRTIETVHFRVHFPEPFEPWARRMAQSIEGIHEGVTAVVGFTPPKKTEVLVCDPQASANGMALPFLDRPVIILWTTPPEAESGIGSYRDWTELLVTHEMAHIVHLTRPRNRPRLLARLLPLPFGPVAINAPRWVIEGYATLIEGELTGSGRPHSSFRAMVLRRFSIEGKLPPYGALSALGGWLGGSMAYLVGSSYLEWLEAREGKGSLVKLWKRMASKKGGSFGTAFRAVFGEAPNDLYDRFRAELTARALEEEKRLAAAGVVEGDSWQRVRGATSSLEISPDGGKLLARRDPGGGKSFLAIWDLRESASAKPGHVDEDSSEIVDKPEVPAHREPKWKLARVNGFAAAEPRFVPDGKRVLFARRAPDSQGALRFDLYLWEHETGLVRRVTRGADVGEADPSPDGRSALGVEVRFGATRLVRIDFGTGETHPIPTDVADSEWPVWSHPRVSPDGATIVALLHRGGRWRLVTVPASGGAVRELGLDALPFGPPAWTPDGTRIVAAFDRTGIWNLVSVDPRGLEPPQTLTSVTGGAFGPAPAPDGSGVFFLSLTAKGVDVRRLALPPAPIATANLSADAYPVLPPLSPAEAPLPHASEVAAASPYRAIETQVVRLFSGFTLGPDGNAWQAGVQGTDVLGRLDWFAAASFGNAAGPRGGVLAAAWKGLPVAINLHLFSSLEKPGSQHLAKRPELDEQRWGGYAGGSWKRPFDWGRVSFEAGGGWTRIEAPATQNDFNRALGSVEASAAFRRRTENLGFGLDGAVAGSLGRTDGASWHQWRGEARAIGFLGPVRLSIAGQSGDTGGAPTRFDLFWLGGASSAILPPGLDRNRVESPALPEAAQVGRRFEAWRAEATISILTLYAERGRAFDPPVKPPLVEAFGGELRLGRLVPAELREGLDLYVGLAKIRSQVPHFDSWRGYAGLIYRP
jgi:hypothetical protein